MQQLGEETKILPKLVIFDLDGTLVDSAEDLALGVNALLGELGRAPVALAALRGMIGDGAHALVQRALAASPGEEVADSWALERFLALYAQRAVVHTALYPGVARTLASFAEAEIPMVVCTNKPEAISRAILTQLGVDGYFGTIIGGDSLPWRKPDPRILEGLLAGRGVKPQACLLIGDSEIDAATAHALSMPFALFTGGYRRGPPETIEAKYRVDRMDELLGLLGIGG